MILNFCLCFVFQLFFQIFQIWKFWWVFVVAELGSPVAQAYFRLGV